MYVLVKFSHGLGDAVQLTCVLQHLQEYRPDWTVVDANVDRITSTGKKNLRHELVAKLCCRILQHASVRLILDLGCQGPLPYRTRARSANPNAHRRFECRFQLWERRYESRLKAAIVQSPQVPREPCRHIGSIVDNAAPDDSRDARRADPAPLARVKKESEIAIP